MKDFPPENLHLNVEVKNINCSSLPVKISSTLGEQSFDYVICTLPLGVLKESKSELFTPQLPIEKLETIDALGFGICNKIYLQFDSDNVFWQPGDVFQVVHKIEIPDSEREWYHAISRFNAVDHNPQLLVAWVAGEDAKAMESESEEEVSRRCCELLSMVLGKKLPKPTALKRSQWYSDPFSRGSYSYISTACDENRPNPLLPSTLASPIMVGDAPVVCFAGEATSEHHFSTVHGAFESGRREAKRIANFVKSNAGPPPCK